MQVLSSSSTAAAASAAAATSAVRRELQKLLRTSLPPPSHRNGTDCCEDDDYDSDKNGDTDRECGLEGELEGIEKMNVVLRKSRSALLPGQRKSIHWWLVAAVCFMLTFATFGMTRNRNIPVENMSLTVRQKQTKSSKSSELEKLTLKKHPWLNDDENRTDDDDAYSFTANDEDHVDPAAVSTSTSKVLDNKQKESLRQQVPAGYKKPDSYYSDTYQLRSKLAAQNDTVKLKQQQKPLAEQWGSWTLTDSKQHTRPDLTSLYAKYPNRDVPFDHFPDTAWQRDTDYVAKFLSEGLALVHRSMEVILAEYGHGANDEPDKSFQERDKAMDLGYLDFVNGPGAIPRKGNPHNIVGYTSQHSMEVLAKRLLHAVVTEDTFTFVMGGHSSAAGHGNHFQQSYTHQAHMILEPVLARLGVTYISRNMGMGGMGTLHNALGAQDIYGPDLDVLMWDSGMTENSDAPQDLFARQGVLGGNRVPIVWGVGGGGTGAGLPKTYETQANVGIGAICSFWGAGQDALPFCLSETQTETTIPWAAQYMRCDPSVASMCREHAYHGTCWIEREDHVQPLNGQSPTVPGRVKWHPGDRYHRFQGRMTAYTILRALEHALTTWNETASNQYVLPDEAWHLHEDYRFSKEKMAALDIGTAPCYQLGFPSRVCQIPLHARTEFTPRANPVETSIRSIMDRDMHIPRPSPNEYDPPDVFNPNLYPPDDVLDAIAVLENGVDFTPLLGRKHLAEHEYQLLLLQQQQQQQEEQQQEEQQHQRRIQQQQHADASALVIKSSTGSTLPPGQGWSLAALAASDNCDGTVDSFCGRSGGCLLYGHNDGRNGLVFDGFSGWIKLTLTDFQHGMVMVLLKDMQAATNPRTEGWACENSYNCSASSENGKNNGDRSLQLRGHQSQLQEQEQELQALVPAEANSDHSRKLKRAAEAEAVYCEDFRFEFALNGGEITSWNKDEFVSRAAGVRGTMRVYTLLDDINFVAASPTNTAMELAFRITGCGRDTAFSLSHVYWA